MKKAPSWRVIALAVALAASFTLLGPQAYAQQTAKVLSSCGTAGYTAGTTNYQTMDTTGAGCSSGGGGGGGAVTTSPAVITTTTTAGSITTGGAAQNALAANSSRKAYCVTNNSALAESLYVRASGTASATVGVPVSSGQQACNQSGTIDQGNISVYAATTGHTFVVAEGQ